MHPQAKVFEKFLFLNEIRATGGWKMDVSIRAHSLLCFKFSGAGLIPVAIRDEKLMEQRKKKEKKKKKKKSSYKNYNRRPNISKQLWYNCK